MVSRLLAVQLVVQRPARKLPAHLVVVAILASLRPLVAALERLRFGQRRQHGF